MRHTREHYLLGAMAFMVTLIVAGLYVYIWKGVDSAVSKSIANRQSYSQATLSIDKERQFLEAYEKTEADWAKLADYLVSSDNVIKFIESVENLGKYTGSSVTLSSIDADNLENAKKGTVGFIRTRVSVKGSWSSVMRVLRLAEALPYKISISKIDMGLENVSSEKNPKTEWTMIIDLKATMVASASGAPIVIPESASGAPKYK